MKREFNPEQNHLTLMVGLPYSGKTYWANQHSSRPIVSLDAIRIAHHGKRYLQEAEPYVWLFAHTMVDALFRAGHLDVILDATNTTVKRRQVWYPKPNGTYGRCLYKYIDTHHTICEQRALANNDNEILPVIWRMREQFESFTKEELPDVYDN
jgi:predicted kinase